MPTDSYPPSMNAHPKADSSPRLGSAAGRVALCFVARWAMLMEAGQRRWRTRSTTGVQPSGRWHAPERSMWTISIGAEHDALTSQRRIAATSASQLPDATRA
jgi:hypothetical protein